MSTRRVARRSILRAVAAVSLLLGFLTPSLAWDNSRIHEPGSFEAIMYAKMPAVYGPHLPAADIPSTYTAPAPGSWLAIMSVKDPQHYGPRLAAADDPPKAGCSLRPGSWEAIMSVKDPQHYGPCGRK